MMDYKEIMYEQLGRDFGVSVGALREKKNLFVRRSYAEGRRIYDSDRCLLRILGTGSSLAISSTDAGLLDWCRENYGDYDAAWISELTELRWIDRKLAGFGEHIADAHHYYIPAQDTAPAADSGLDTRWYELGELEQFREDDRFSEALAFEESHPDMLAVAAVESGEIVGMAGASADAPMMWQIGVNVLPEAAGRGVGTALVRLLRDEVLRRGRLPFYGTVESHIVSSRIAIAAGFLPAWWELYSAPDKKTSEAD